MDFVIALLPLLTGSLLDLAFGDPERLPHPIVWFGKIISKLEHRLNNGSNKKIKGGIVAVFLIAGVFALTSLLLHMISPIVWLNIAIQAILIFYCLAGTTLIREVKMTFEAIDRSLEAGRKQVGRIVGRDTSEISAIEIRTAALETLAENLSDGVIAPLFWYAVAGVPGMLAYKMVNTLDSMIGYRNERYRDFGCVAAHIDDIANYLPARLTALLMVIASGHIGLIKFVKKFGREHASPNSGYPEAAMAGILDCRFGGPHNYFGETVDKPFIGVTQRDFSTADVIKAININRRAELMAIVLTAIVKISVVLI